MPWQAAAVVYPDIELVLIPKIKAALAARAEPYAAGALVSNNVPDSRSPRMVIVRRDGGTQAELRDRPRVALRIWASTEKDASALAALVIALCQTFVDGNPILRVGDISGPSPVPDSSDQPLRYAVINFETRGVPL